MKKLLPFFILIPVLNISCEPKPRVQVTISGFRLNNLSLAEPKNLTICVSTEEEPNNPVLSCEIRDKIQQLLSDKGYNVTCARPDFCCTFSYGVSENRTASFEVPIYGLKDKDKKGRSNKAVYVPYSYSIQGHYILLTLYDAREYKRSNNDVSTLEDTEPVWTGEITSYGTGPDTRMIIDCMLIAASEHFAEDTEKQVTELISIDDKQVKNLNRDD